MCSLLFVCSSYCITSCTCFPVIDNCGEIIGKPDFCVFVVQVVITKAPGEILGLAVVESGWGSILPTVVVANLLHGGPAERCGELSIGDRIMSVNGTSLVGLPITTCQNIIRDLKSQKYVKLSIVHCPPVTMAIIRRPDPKFQLGFSVEDGIVCQYPYFYCLTITFVALNHV
ncbi:amyloid-beta A4 precursor protein-binding family A member 3-like [Seriola lalandi dorsalis]|uniref:amyloid-beta A4 precursor protein-binding family A member 3-like n=1 Tax=Seriola lalandi dorsalis TaxID=1841481 RepID=UPI000C6F4D9D|nr:amyloid-beta A4 precursor protein-binding family A member 3-like [Seriola lalandi dorsalis]